MARRDVREEGLVGTLFYKRGERRPALIWLTGSGGGEVRGHAALLASRGFTCLSLAYFNAEALPKGLWEIPLEYFETAIRWLQRQDCVVPDALGATGISRGGELALLLGATFPQIRAVAAHVPSSVVWAGLGPGYAVNERSAWSYRGAPLPFLKGNAEGLNWRDKPVRLDQFYRNAMSDEAAVERAAIPVEKINGPVIMMSGTDDGMWPSTMMAELLMKRFKDKGFRHRAEHLCYQGAGHGIAHVYVPTTQILGFHQVAPITVTGGGTPKVNSDANKDAWPKVVAFLHEALG
jgi:dienelactone hydrolase